MRILALDQFSEPGGAQRCLLDALTAFRSAGWIAHVGLPGNGPIIDQVRALGCDVLPIACGPYRSGTKSAGDWLRFGADIPRMALQIRRAVLAFDPDVIYVNGPRVLPGVAAAATGLPVVFHSHSLVPHGLMRKVSTAALRSVRARVIANCRFVAEQWSQDFAVDVIYNGVQPPAAPRSVRQGPPVIACIGRIAPEKGQLAFVQAARRILQSIPDARFVVWGSAIIADPSYEAEVRRAAAGLPIEFAGWAQDVYAALAQTDILLTPSSAIEATTRVIPEAWASGVPVIAFATGGIAEIVRHGENGFLVGKTIEMAEYAVRLLTSGSWERETVALQAHRTWEERFRPERFARDLLETLSRATCADGATSERRSRPAGPLPSHDVPAARP